MDTAARSFTLRLERGHVRFVAGAVLVVSLLLLTLSVATTSGGRTAFGTSLGADYAAFYTAGTILNHYPADRLYDLELQYRLFHQLFPYVPEGEILPYANPPFVVGLFRPLACLPYTASFLIWLAMSAGLYVAGLLLLLGVLNHIPAADKKLLILLAVSFEPFVMECWLGGQLSAFGFLCVAIAFRLERQGRALASGLALGCCLYKPTLLPLILPMLLLARRWRMLAGFGLTAVVLAGASWVVAGSTGCRDYAHLMLGYAGAVTSSQTVFRLWKFVDLNSCLKLLCLSAAMARGLVLAVVLVFLSFLTSAWWRMPKQTERQRTLVWAGTIAATLVVNVYVGIYDSTLVVLSVLLTLDVLCRPDSSIAGVLPRPYRVLLILLYLTPWLSQGLARWAGVQPYTLILAAVAVYPFSLLAARSRPLALAPVCS